MCMVCAGLDMCGFGCVLDGALTALYWPVYRYEVLMACCECFICLPQSCCVLHGVGVLVAV